MQAYEVEIHILFFLESLRSVTCKLSSFFLKKHLNIPKLSCILYARDINVFLGLCVLDSHDVYTTEILDTLNE